MNKLEKYVEEILENLKELKQEVEDDEDECKCTKKKQQEIIDTMEMIVKETYDFGDWEEVKEKTVYDLECGDKYFAINFNGQVYRYTWENMEMEKHAREFGNIFLTKQEAENKVGELKLEKKARESQNGFKPNWRDEEQSKYYMFYYEHSQKVEFSDYIVVNTKPSLGYWESEEEAKKFIEENKEELIWYFTHE